VKRGPRYFAAGCGDADGWGEAVGAGAAELAVVGWAAAGAAAACGCALGLIQQAWTWLLRLFGTLSSI
jgi:hypothetical protein